MDEVHDVVGWLVAAGSSAAERRKTEFIRIQNPESRIQMGGCRTRSDESAGIQNSESRIQNPNGGLSDAICTRAKTLRISSAGIQNSESRIQNPKGGLSDAICTFWRTLEYRNTEYTEFSDLDSTEGILYVHTALESKQCVRIQVVGIHFFLVWWYTCILRCLGLCQYHLGHSSAMAGARAGLSLRG